MVRHDPSVVKHMRQRRARRSRAGGTLCSGWSSCCGSPRRTRSIAERDAATASANDICPAFVDEENIDAPDHVLSSP